MSITMYNVEFGESLLIQHEKENLILDMGSEYSRFIFEDIWEDSKRHSALPASTPGGSEQIVNKVNKL